MLFLAHQKVKNTLFIVGFGLFLYHIIVHCQYIIFWLISYKLIAVHILVHAYHTDYGSYLSSYIIFSAWQYLSSYAFLHKK